MKYQIEKNTDIIRGIFNNSQDVENWDINWDDWKIEQSDVYFDCGEIFNPNKQLTADDLRAERIEAFEDVDKYQLILVYNDLTDAQKAELVAYRQAWLDVTETMIKPAKPDWMV